MSTNQAQASEKNEESGLPKPTFPEGGFKAWMAVLACWCIMFNTFGYLNAFGIYQSYYKSTLLKDESNSRIAWIGSIQVFFLLSSGLISGPMTDRYGPMIILVPCSVLFIAAVMLTSICTKYYQFMLAQGVLGGLANGLTYTPAVAVISQYFFRRRPLAMGIVSSGSSLAGVIVPIALDRLLNRSNVGFGWSVRIIGFLMMALSIVACVFVSPNAPKRRDGIPFLLRAWKNKAYTVQVAGMFLVLWAMFMPFFYIPVYAESISISVDLSYYLISVLNATSLFGRVLGGALANRIGLFNTLFGASAICGILILFWLLVKSYVAMVLFSALFGFFSGAVIGLFPATIVLTAAQPNEIGSYLGMALGVYSLAGLSGTPITGAMINTYGTYNAAIIFAGVSCLVGAAIVFAARLFYAGTKLIA